MEELTMKKFTKKIAAMGAAVMMAVSMMSVSVSASANISLHYEVHAPSSENVSIQVFGDTYGSPYFSNNSANKATLITNISSFNASKVTTTLRRYNSTDGGWDLLGNGITHKTTGYKSKNYTPSGLPKNTPLRITAVLTNGSSSYSYGYGYTTAY